MIKLNMPSSLILLDCVIIIVTMSPVESLPSAPQSMPGLPLSTEVGGMAESAIGGIESMGTAALGIGLGILLFKRGIEAILFQKNPLRPLFNSK